MTSNLKQSFDSFLESYKEKHPNVVIKLKNYSNSVVVIDIIFIPKGKRRQGLGSEIMRELIKIADSNNSDLVVNPSDTMGTSLQVLIKFYQKFGFVPVSPQKIGTRGQPMVRTPQSA